MGERPDDDGGPRLVLRCAAMPSRAMTILMYAVFLLSGAGSAEEFNTMMDAMIAEAPEALRATAALRATEITAGWPRYLPAQ